MLPTSDIAAQITNPVIHDVVMCESDGKQFQPDGTLTTGKAGELGIAQFKPATFSWMSAAFKADTGQTLDIDSAADQIILMQYAFNHHWQNNWTCYLLLKNAGKL